MSVQGRFRFILKVVLGSFRLTLGSVWGYVYVSCILLSLLQLFPHMGGYGNLALTLFELLKKVHGFMMKPRF